MRGETTKGVEGLACEVCGAPAAVRVRDDREVFEGSPWTMYRKAALHAFCAAHYRPSVVIPLDDDAYARREALRRAAEAESYALPAPDRKTEATP